MSQETGEATSRAIFSDAEHRILAAALDEIIPGSADGTRPGAGEVGLQGHFERAVGEAPALAPTLRSGVEALDRLARQRGAAGFAELGRSARLEVLNELGAIEPAFVPTLMFLAYLGYYQHERVLAALGVGPHPPHPKGYEMEPDDLTLLDPVRCRPKLYREC